MFEYLSYDLSYQLITKVFLACFFGLGKFVFPAFHQQAQSCLITSNRIEKNLGFSYERIHDVRVLFMVMVE